MFFFFFFCFATLSGTFSRWYWTFHKNDVPFFTLISSFNTTIVYHVGSIAFGSFLISVMRFIRIVLEFIDRNCTKYNHLPAVQYIKTCFRCCFWCLEVFIRFINRNAYIYMAMFGTSFIESAQKAFAIITQNIVRSFVLDYLSDFLFFLSRILLTSIVTVLGYYVFTNQIPEVGRFDLEYYWGPLAAFAYLSYVLTGILFGVYKVAIETLFFCYCKFHLFLPVFIYLIFSLFL